MSALFFIKKAQAGIPYRGDWRSRYARLTVPPRYWFGFQGLEGKNSLLMNVTDLPHDPAEVLRKSIKEIKYDWSGV